MSDYIPVYLSAYLVQLNNLDTDSQTIQATMYYWLRWPANAYDSESNTAFRPDITLEIQNAVKEVDIFQQDLYGLVSEIHSIRTPAFRAFHEKNRSNARAGLQCQR